MNGPQTDQRDPELVAADRRAAILLAFLIAAQIILIVAARLCGFWR